MKNVRKQVNPRDELLVRRVRGLGYYDSYLSRVLRILDRIHHEFGDVVVVQTQIAQQLAEVHSFRLREYFRGSVLGGGLNIESVFLQ